MAKYRVTIEIVTHETWVVDEESANGAMTLVVMDSHHDGKLVDSEVVGIDPLFADLLED